MISTITIRQLAALVASVLSDDLRKPEYRGNPTPLAGHCYVASEALYHLAGGPRSGLRPMNLVHEGTQHWFLADAAGEVFDVTANQFHTPVPYALARGRGFLTRQPSKRAAEVIRRVQSSL